VLVDHRADAVATIRRNLEVLGADAGRATVVRADAVTFAATATPPGPTTSAPRGAVTSGPKGRFDLVLADPPYDFDRWPDLLAGLAARTGLLVAETGWDRGASPWSPGPGWETVKVRRYGGTVVSIAQPESQSPEHHT
jgi:16S rRNA G966 N2-methylase RsmD